MKNDPDKRTIGDLLAVMAALRSPSTGCPWDLEQTFATIAPYTIEEAYEVADAIQRGDLVDLEEELGDLLLQVVYHARMAEEAGAFDFSDVADAITRKMVRRHPHVFGTAEQRARGAEPGFWSRLKGEEKKAQAAERARLGLPPKTASPSLLADIPHALPALTRAVKLQDKAAKVGFDWPSLGPVFKKMEEELAELEEIAVPADPRGTTPDRLATDKAKIEEEYGDLLFVVANVARHLGIDPEAALRGANAKFERRFGHIETRLAEQGRSPDQSTLEEMDRYWDEAKTKEQGR